MDNSKRSSDICGIGNSFKDHVRLFFHCEFFPTSIIKHFRATSILHDLIESKQVKRSY